jgi:hypothetical protein
VASVGRAVVVEAVALVELVELAELADRVAQGGRAEKEFRMECQAARGARAAEEFLDEEDHQGQMEVMGPMPLLPQTAL